MIFLNSIPKSGVIGNALLVYDHGLDPFSNNN